MKKIFISSPLRGDYQNNICKAKGYARFAFLQRYMPLVPNIYITQFVDETNPDEADIGLLMALNMLLLADELWVFFEEDNQLTEGMKLEVMYWEKNKGVAKIRYFNQELEEVSEEYVKSYSRSI